MIILLVDWRAVITFGLLDHLSYYLITLHGSSDPVVSPRSIVKHFPSDYNMKPSPAFLVR